MLLGYSWTCCIHLLGDRETARAVEIETHLFLAIVLPGLSARSLTTERRGTSINCIAVITCHAMQRIKLLLNRVHADQRPA